MIRLMVLIILICILFFYILGHSFFIVNTGLILTVLAACGIICYVALNFRRS